MIDAYTDEHGSESDRWADAKALWLAVALLSSCVAFAIWAGGKLLAAVGVM